jgi:hypothetical protein
VEGRKVANAKRLYVYGVMGVALVALLWGLASVLRIIGRNVAATAGSREAVGAEGALDELSLALALILVALPVWLIHAWLAQRPLSGSPAQARDERASPARATYFFLVLTVAGGAALLQLYASLQELWRAALTDQRTWGLAGAVAWVIVTGLAWLGHLWWRRADLRAAPARLADDWLTRAYLYSGLFILALLLAFWIGNAVAVVAGELIEPGPRWDPWQESFVGPAAGVIGAAVGWSAQWLIGRWLVRTDPPLGTAHRASRTRTGYFLAVVFVAAVAVLVTLVTSLQQVFARIMGVWQSFEGTPWLEDVLGPLVLGAPFAVAWWWHWRQGTREALAWGGQERHAAVRRTGLYVLAFVGLGGLSIGVAWALVSVLSYLDAAEAFRRDDVLSENGAPALAAFIVGLALWLPTWSRARADLATAPAEVAASLPRRAYLLLVSGLAVVVLMLSLALLVYRLMQTLLDTGDTSSETWPLAGALVAAVVLAYHLWRLRLDGQLVAAAQPAAADRDDRLESRAVETVEISAPPGHDLEALNEAIRGGLPDGVELRVVREARDQA